MRRTPTGAKTWLPRLLVVPPSRARAEPQVCIPAKLSGYAFYHSTSVPFVQPCCHTESSQWTLAEGGKRDYVRWLPQEEGVFYSALRGVAGQKPEVCLRHITAQLGGSKDYPQVRHYYYRLIKRLNKLLGEGATLDTRNPLQIHQSMLKFWEVVSWRRSPQACYRAPCWCSRCCRRCSPTLLPHAGAPGAASPSASCLRPCSGDIGRIRCLPRLMARLCPRACTALAWQASCASHASHGS
jgi:hypothetical protein